MAEPPEYTADGLDDDDPPMKHSAAELIELIHAFHPRGIGVDSPLYNATEERRRQMEAMRAAAAAYPRWRAMLGRLRARFPDCKVVDLALHLHGDTFGATYPGKLIPSALSSDEGAHELCFQVSILAPYYVIYSARLTYRKDDPRGPRTSLVALPDIHLDFTPSEQPYADGLAEEIEATYGYELMPPEVGRLLVPDVGTNLRGIGEATIYDCLLSDEWMR